MKKTMCALVLVWVVGLSAVCFAGEESWEALVNDSNIGLCSATFPDGSFVVGYNSSGDMYFTLKTVDQAGVISEGLDVKHETILAVALRNLLYTVEGGQKYFYAVGIHAYTVSEAEGFVYKYDSNRNLIWKKYLRDFYEIKCVISLGDSLFISGNSQGSPKKIGWSKISYDGVVDTSFTVHSSVAGYPMKVLHSDNTAVVFGYKLHDTAKTIVVNLLNGQLLLSKDYYNIGTQVKFCGAEKIFINGIHSGYMASGDEGYYSTDLNMLFRLDLNLNVIATKQYDGRVGIQGVDGNNFVLGKLISGNVFTYHKMDYLWNENESEEYTFMDGLAGGITKVGDAYLGFGISSVGSGTYVRYYKPNLPPVADAGDDQTVFEGATVQLVGTGSDPDDADLVFLWTQVFGPTVTLIVATANEVSFEAPTVGPDGATLEFQLSASDGSLSDTDTLVIHVTNVNQAPVAYAGPDLTEDEGLSVTLAGSGNDPDGDTLTYQWTQTSGPAVTLDDADTAHPSFTTPQVDGNGVTLTFQLTVSDGQTTATDACVVNVTYENEVPEADAGDDQTATEGETVTLSGTGSDPDGQDVTYQWTQTSGPSVLLVNPDTAHPTFTTPGVDHLGAVLAFQLTVSDGSLTATDTCVVNVTYDNQVPLADAGNDQTVNEGETVTLSGTGSDPDGDTVSYLWTQISGTAVTLINATSATASFTAPSVGESGVVFTFRLTTSDGSLVKNDTCTITVNNVADPDPDPNPDDDDPDDDADATENSSGGGGGGCFIGSLM